MDWRSILGEEPLQVSGSGVLPACWRGDSRKVKKGDGFVAIPGNKHDGHLFLPAVLAAGASAVVYRDETFVPPPGVTALRVADPGRAFSRLVRHSFGEPDRELMLVGVTGTNGKTTTAYLLEHLFQTGGLPCGLISTVEYRDGKNSFPAGRTTPDPETLFGMFRAMRDNGLKAAALELSSHALDQGRAAGCGFRAAIFTNLTGDHLDYHKDMEHYYQAKKRFFTELLAPDGVAVVNVDDPFGARLAGELEGVRRVVSFGAEQPGADWRMEKMEFSSAGGSFVLAGKEFAWEVGTSLAGAYNLHNLAGAILAALECGIAPGAIDRALSVPVAAPGRLERHTSPAGANFFVDYAHTDDALRNALGALKRFTAPGKRLFVLFGAGGDRDRSKRPRMGRAAAEIADVLLVTSDNPRSENPEAIISEIVEGIPGGTAFEVIPDRRTAILRAVSLAAEGDNVLVAGKGHEDYQEICGIRHHFSDREELEQAFLSDKTLKK